MTNIASQLSDKIFLLDTTAPRILFSMLFKNIPLQKDGCLLCGEE